jgi:hypothetical protein
MSTDIQAFLDSGVVVTLAESLELDNPAHQLQIELAVLKCFQSRIANAIADLEAGRPQHWFELLLEDDPAASDDDDPPNEDEHAGCDCAICNHKIGPNSGCASPVGSVHQSCYAERDKDPAGWV